MLVVQLLSYGVSQAVQAGERLLCEAALEVLILEALGLLGQAGEGEVAAQVGLHLELLPGEVRGKEGRRGDEHGLGLLVV